MLRTRHRVAGLLVAAATVVSACGNSSDAGATVEDSTAETFSIAGTEGELIPIDSDNVAMAGYEASSRVMTVLFDEGRLYQYFDVPPGLWERFVAAQPDPWSTVGYPELVEGGYSYQRIG